MLDLLTWKPTLMHSTGQLHRPALSKALRDHPEEPLRSEHQASVRIVVQEVCVNIIALAEALYNHDKLLTRHTVSSVTAAFKNDSR